MIGRQPLVTAMVRGSYTCFVAREPGVWYVGGEINYNVCRQYAGVSGIIFAKGYAIIMRIGGAFSP